jgi:hypothetical protein
MARENAVSHGSLLVACGWRGGQLGRTAAGRRRNSPNGFCPLSFALHGQAEDCCRRHACTSGNVKAEPSSTVGLITTDALNVLPVSRP